MSGPGAPCEPLLPLVVTRPQALEAGLTDGRIRHLVLSGRWRPVGRGVYLRQEESEKPGSPHEQRRLMHRLAAEAAAARRPGSVIGRGSAAILHGLPLVTGLPEEACLLVPDGAWSGRRTAVRSHVAGHLEADTITVTGVSGVPVQVTSVERTWADISRSGPVADALSVGDAALRAGR